MTSIDKKKRKLDKKNKIKQFWKRGIVGSKKSISFSRIKCFI